MKKVTVQVPQEAAFERAETQWGDLPVDNFEDVLKSLFTYERKALSVLDEKLYIGKSHTPNGFNIKIEADSTKTKDVVAAIKAKLEICNAKKEETKKEAEKKLDEILKNPENYFSKTNLSRCYPVSESDVQKLAKTAGRDPKVYENALDGALNSLKKSWTEQILKCFREDRKLEVDGLPLYFSQVANLAERHNISEILEILKVRKEAEAKEKEIKEAQKEAFRLVWLEWAKEHGSEDLKLAIEDDYPLGQAVEMQVLDHLLPRETENLTTRFSVESNEDRRVPNKKAREAKSYLEQQVAASGMVPEGTEVVVGRIQSVEVYVEHDCEDPEYCDECDRDGDILLKRTAIPVTVKAAHHNVTRWYLIKEE